MLNFKQKSKIPKEYTRLFDEVSLSAHKKFNDLVTNLYAVIPKKGIDAFFSSPLSRNVFESPLFFYFASFLFLKKLKKTHSIKEINTDSKAFKEAAKKLGLKVNYFSKIKQKFFFIFVIFKVLFRHLFVFFLFKFTVLLKHKITDKIILIDTFFLSENIRENHFYGDMEDFVSLKKSIFYVPSFQYNLSLISVIKLRMDEKKRYLFKEDYLKIIDYFYAFFYFFRILKFRRNLFKNKIFFEELNFSQLAGEEIFNYRSFNSSFMAILNFYFAKRLKAKKIKISLVINWFENQVVCKGFNLGFNTFYNNTLNKGYIAHITSKHYLCVYPIEIEAISNLLPKKNSVMGEGLKPIFSKFYKGLDFEIAPAFRYAHLHKYNFSKKAGKKISVLLATSILESEAVYAINFVRELSKRLENDFDFLIKLHPAMTSFKNKFKNKFKDMNFTNLDFNTAIKNADILISSESSVCYEGICMGKFLIVFANGESGFIQNPIHTEFDEKIYCLCHSVDEAEKKIKFALSLDLEERGKIAKKLREVYFKKADKESTKRFLEL